MAQIGATSGTGMFPALGGGGAAAGGAHTRVGGKKNPLRGLYLPQLVPTLLIVVVGVLNMWSASQSIDTVSFRSYLVGIALGLVCAYLVWRYDYRALAGLTTPLFVVSCVLMVLPHVPGLGVTVNGMTGWVQVPLVGFRFQPSEPGKLAVIFLMAAAAGQYNGKIDAFRDYVRLCGTLLVPVALMMVTDLGTGLVMFVAGATVITCSGAPKGWVAATWALVVVGAALIVAESLAAQDIDWLPGILKEYQLNRLLVFTDHSLDPTETGYQLQQSMVAVGSGGLLGKGFGNASQALNGFLPESQTDFVFALFAEQFGFVGSAVLLLLFAWMITATVLLALRVDQVYSKLLLVGIAAMWLFQVLEEVGMSMGIMPVTGIPLPFMSYGSSSMVVQLTAMGAVQSVWRHRKKAA